MVGILYIILSIITGFAISSVCIPNLYKITKFTYTGKILKVNSLLFLMPFWYVVGTLIMTWFTYFTAYVLHVQFNLSEPLFVANIIVMSIMIIINAIIIYKLYKNKYLNKLYKNCMIFNWLDILYVLSTLLVGIMIMNGSFYWKDDSLYISGSVYSDFSCHLGMIRSFSVNNNYPTQYVMYGDADIKYHFMFQFLVGNLEYLGLRIDLALNIPSILSFMGALNILYILAIKLTGKRFCGWLTSILLYFRSSFSLYYYILENRNNLSEALSVNEVFGYTACEDWSLWNIKVYMNQRHLAFGIIIVYSFIVIMLPYLYKSINRLQYVIKNKSKLESIKLSFKYSLLHKKGWLPTSYTKAIFLGLVLGMLSFFHGSCVIALLAMLFFMAICSDNRIEYLIIAIISLIITIFNTNFFINGATVNPTINIGFLAQDSSLIAIIDYLIKCFGIFTLLLLIAFLQTNNINKYVYFIFSVPFIISFIISLTPDIAVNHKFIIISINMLNISISYLIYKFLHKDFWYKIIAIICVITLISTGVYENKVIFNWNREAEGINLKENECLNWLIENTDESDLVLASPPYFLITYMMAGTIQYLGYNYAAGSAGYDVETREELAQKVFFIQDQNTLLELIKEMNVDYIIIDDWLRGNMYNDSKYLSYLQNIEYAEALKEDPFIINTILGLSRDDLLVSFDTLSEYSDLLTEKARERGNTAEEIIKKTFVKVAEFEDYYHTQIFDTHKVYIYEN